MADQNYIRIQKYLSGQMEADDLHLFEAELLINPELANDVKLHKEVIGFIGNYKRNDDFRKVLDEVHQKYIAEFNMQEPEEKRDSVSVIKKRKIPLFVYWVAAASIFAILVFTVVLNLNQKKKSNEILFAENYRTQEPFNVRSADSLQKDLSTDCMNKYSNKNYHEALLCFLNILNQDNNNRIGIFFSGISYIETQNYQKAISSFNRLIEIKDFNFSESAIWYSGLCFLKINKTDSALTCFRKLTLKDNFYKKQAEKIIKELE